ncbi:MAG: hypothetical protein QOG63_1524 [Thermoleophilaceae bacterium]|jgi:hypothetical protein|nr:hypothetical protein [Thermoleophilaceae bacterium]
MSGARALGVVALVVASPAAAEPLRLPPDRGAVLTGDRVIQLRGSDSRGFAVFTTPLSRALGAARVIARIPGSRGQMSSIELAASARLLAYSRTVENRPTDDSNLPSHPFLSEIRAAPFGAPPELVYDCDPVIRAGLPVAVDGDVLAYEEGCSDHQWKVTIRRGAATDGFELPDLAGDVQVAGRYVAWGEAFYGPLKVFDLKAHALVLDSVHWPAPGNSVLGWVLQSDGKVGLLYDDGDRAASATRLGWLSPAEPYLHEVAGGSARRAASAYRLELADNRFAYVAYERSECNRLTIVTLAGRRLPVGCAPIDEADFDWNGRWVAWSAYTCSGARPRLAAPVRDVDAGLPGTARPCPIRLYGRHQSIRVSQRRGGRLRLRCSRGCEGFTELRLPRRGRRGPLVADGSFRLRPGHGRSSGITWALTRYGDAPRRPLRRPRDLVVWVSVHREGDGHERRLRSLGRVHVVPS